MFQKALSNVSSCSPSSQLLGPRDPMTIHHSDEEDGLPQRLLSIGLNVKAVDSTTHLTNTPATTFSGNVKGVTFPIQSDLQHITCLTLITQTVKVPPLVSLSLSLPNNEPLRISSKSTVTIGES